MALPDSGGCRPLARMPSPMQTWVE